jgi:hypothetical protein
LLRKDIEPIAALYQGGARMMQEFCTKVLARVLRECYFCRPDEALANLQCFAPEHHAVVAYLGSMVARPLQALHGPESGMDLQEICCAIHADRQFQELGSSMQQTQRLSISAYLVIADSKTSVLLVMGNKWLSLDSHQRSVDGTVSWL